MKAFIELLLKTCIFIGALSVELTDHFDFSELDVINTHNLIKSPSRRKLQQQSEVVYFCASLNISDCLQYVQNKNVSDYISLHPSLYWLPILCFLPSMRPR